MRKLDEARERVLLSAPNHAGEQFVKLLQRKRVPYAVIVNNQAEFKRMGALGAERIIMVNTAKEDSWHIPETPVGKVYLFEKSLTLCCRYIQICRSWTSGPLYVITGSGNPRHVYKGLGADYVVHSGGRDFAFLIADGISDRS